MKLKLIVVAIAACVLVACGGGGGGAGNATTALRWGTDEVLDPNTESATPNGSVAIGADGSGYAVWIKTTATVSQVLARRYTGSAWEAAQVVATAEPGVTFEDPRVVQGANGDVIAVWVEERVGDRLMSARTVGGVWQGAVVAADSLGGREIADLHLAGNGKGQAVALWNRTKTDAPPFDTFDSLISGFGTGGFLPPVQLNADSINAAAFGVAMDATGQAVLAWTDQIVGGAAGRILMQTYKDGNLQDAVALQTPPATVAGDVNVALEAGNKAAVAWLQQSVASGGLSVEFTTASDFMQGNWQPPQTLPTTGSPDAVDVALDPQGTSTVVWSEKNGDVRNVMAVRLGARPLPAQRLETDDRGDVRNPLVASDASGGALVMWVQDIDPNISPAASTFRPFTSRFDPATNAWGQVEAVDTGLPAIGNASAHALSVAADGRALAVWTEVTHLDRILTANVFK